MASSICVSLFTSLNKKVRCRYTPRCTSEYMVTFSFCSTLSKTTLYVNLWLNRNRFIFSWNKYSLLPRSSTLKRRGWASTKFFRSEKKGKTLFTGWDITWFNFILLKQKSPAYTELLLNLLFNFSIERILFYQKL